MQASLAIVGFTSACIAWLINSNSWWLIGGMLLGLVVPYTLIGMMPINKCLLSQTLDKHSQETRDLLRKWGYMHMIRSILGLIALIIFLLNG